MATRIDRLYEVYRAVAGNKPQAAVPGKVLTELPIPLMTAWLHLDTIVANLVTNREGSSIKDVAAEIYTAWEKCFAPTEPVFFSSLPPAEKLAWEALTRQTWAFFDGDEEPDGLEGHEERWKQWAEARMPKILVGEAK